MRRHVIVWFLTFRDEQVVGNKVLRKMFGCENGEVGEQCRILDQT
jgi:hypothetical protein